MTTVYGIEFDYISLGTDSDDTLTGMNGDDFVNGFDGVDSIIGFAGDDVLLGDNIPVDEYLDTEDLTFADTLSALYESVREQDFSWVSPSDVSYAMAGIQQFFAENQALLNHAATYGDDDTIIGGKGNDIIYGGAGDDALRGGSGNDVLIGLAGDNALLGGTGDDVLIGGIGNDRLFGNDGSDYLVGTSGNDFYFGGEGQDTFMFTNLLPGEQSVDRVVDFEQGTDTIFLLNVASSFDSLVLEESGPTVQLTLSDTHSIIFNNSQLSDFSSDDFIFYNV